ncbi:ISL3 family transposase [Thiocapsa rosea]|uniref:Transposase n=1 Tax=Thiocapsa rosea TaxID=69360 RepID=A0A495VAQ3_9GAMM|nr:ISL3 family transposase [Thiocapsa rosea]RKT46364.1 transposase [Thiocapsa rosea]RKT46926.1 transposase [Thiocapsa rosea]
MIDQSQLLRLLGLPQIAIDRVEITDAAVLEIHVHSTEEGTQCRSCGRRITEPHGLGEERRLRHLSIFEHRTEILIRPKRYRCPDCRDHPTTTQRVDWYDPRSGFTRAFEHSLMRALINSTLEDVAHKEAVTPEHLDGILDRCVPSQIDWTTLTALPVLGLDEIALTKGHGNFVVIVSARVEDTLSILAVLKDRKRATVEAFLRTIPKSLRRTVRVVCTDLYSGFIGAAKAVFGTHVAICADRFHVARLYRDAVETLRKTELRRLKRDLSKTEYGGLKNVHWILRKRESDLSAEERRIRARLFAYSPQLAQAHALSQALTEVYDMPLSKGQAKRKLSGWMRRVKNAEMTCFQSFLKTLRRHWDEITNYFTERHTSGFVEGLNNKIKVLKRRCYGLSNLRRLYQRVYLDLCGYRVFAR